ncbi:MAG TPA: hypothetical protein VF097_00590 [Actinomycetota bacterium]
MIRGRHPLLALVAVVAASCGPGDVRVSSVPIEEVGFVTQIVDVQGEAGAGISIAADAEGSPHLAYLAFERELEEGEQPPPPDPNLPLFPAVRHAHQAQGVWSRGTAAEELGDLTQGDGTAIAVDGDGMEHIAWTEGGRLRYSSNGGGAFSEPETVVRADELHGVAIAAAEDGTPSISFYDVPGGPEGPAALVRVATPAGGGWEVETAAEADPNQPMSTGIGITQNGAIVAYGSGPTTYVARDLEDRWESEEVDAGGLGVSLDLDADGNPHVSYYTSDGTVRHAHSVGGGPWETSDVGSAGQGPGSDWVTSISVDPEGVHWVAWQTAEGLGLASNEEGSFQEHDLPGTQGGVRPQVATGAEGAVYVAWHDTEDGTANVSSRTSEEPLLAGPPETGAPQPGPTGDGGGGGGGDGGPPPCEPSGTELAIVAPVGAVADGFDTDCLAAPAGEAFTIDFDNQDTGVPHNVSIYADDTAAERFFEGEIITGPDQITYEPDPIDDAGVFYFHCDVHPNMNGAFVVQ